jgi:hypothetical protein
VTSLMSLNAESNTQVGAAESGAALQFD